MTLNNHDFHAGSAPVVARSAEIFATYYDAREAARAVRTVPADDAAPDALEQMYAYYEG